MSWRDVANTFAQRAHGRGLLNLQILTSASGTVYTPTPGTLSILVEVQGGGSAGGGAVATGVGQASIGGGGLSGAYLLKWFPFIDAATYAYNIGGGGVGGTGIGGVGGDTTFTGPGGLLLTAHGASSGGGQSTATSGPIIITTGATVGDTAINGDLNISGSLPLPGVILSATMFYAGRGGSSRFGVGNGANGAPGSTAVAATITGYGVGGSCPQNGASASASVGGNGQPGVIFVWEFA